MFALKKLATLAAAGMLTACVTPSSGNDGFYASPIGDAPVTSNPTAYTPALQCLADYSRSNAIAAPRIAVGRIIDYTGAVSEEGGRRITQGASLMAISAFAKSGARLVERFDTSVTELELRYANNRLIGEEGNGRDNVRAIFAGQMPGSDYTFVGGITEMNYNIRSVGVDAQVGHSDARDGVGNIGGRLYVMNIAMDFRLIDTRSLEVIDVISYQKQIIGREVRAGVFSFFGDTMVDIAAGERGLEPVQLAVRAGVERAVIEVMSNVYRVGPNSPCADAIAAEGDPMGEPRQHAQATNAPNAAPIVAAGPTPIAEPLVAAGAPTGLQATNAPAQPGVTRFGRDPAVGLRPRS